MASNVKLIEQILVLAAALDITVDTENMNNAALSTLLSDLKAKQRDAENHTQADGDEPSSYKVACLSLTSKRGILVKGNVVEASDLAGGEKSFEALIEKGLVK